MRVFVCEFVTGGGFSGAALPAGLAREGGMMLAALVKDLAEVPGTGVAATLDERAPDGGLQAGICRIAAGSDPWAAWRRHILASDATWPIAPETDGILERLARLVLDCDRILLGCRPEAVRLAASKQHTASHLAERGLPTVPTLPLAGALASGLPPGGTGWVVKPDDGAGSEDTILLRSEDDVRRWSAARRDIGRFVIQPHLAGAAASFTMLCRDGAALLLACNTQDIVHDGDRLHYRGGIVGGREDRRAAYAPVAAGIAAALPGLWGLVGVDLMDTRDGPVVLEVNPRLTTTYAGLRHAIGMNPAALVLQLRDRSIGTLPVPERVRAHAITTAHAA